MIEWLKRLFRRRPKHASVARALDDFCHRAYVRTACRPSTVVVPFAHICRLHDEAMKEERFFDSRTSCGARIVPSTNITSHAVALDAAGAVLGVLDLPLVEDGWQR